MNLPGVFENLGLPIPSKTPYLAAEPGRVARWKRRIGDQGIPASALFGRVIEKTATVRSILPPSTRFDQLPQFQVSASLVFKSIGYRTT